MTGWFYCLKVFFKYAIKPAKPILLIRVSIFSRFPKFNRDPLVSGKGYLTIVFSRTSADYHIKTRQGRDSRLKNWFWQYQSHSSCLFNKNKVRSLTFAKKVKRAWWNIPSLYGRHWLTANVDFQNLFKTEKLCNCSLFPVLNETFCNFPISIVKWQCSF